MLFCSAVFLFLFLPVTVLVYFLLTKRSANAGRIWLLAASLFFYGYFNWRYLFLLFFSIIFNHACAVLLKRYKSRLLFGIGVAVNLGMLGYYKYYDFFIDNINVLLGMAIPLKHLLLPLGISFFTFQQIAYLNDVRTERVDREYSFLTYALFVTFFPQLIAGPIVLPEELIPQLEDPKKSKFNAQNFSTGLFIFILGLSKKLLLADYLALTADPIMDCTAEQSFLTVWTGLLCYFFQLYFDFSGYSDMAIGLGLLFNITLPINFKSPLKAASIQEFWRTWHITLGRFLGTFVYRPLGGSKKSKFRTMCNLVITFIACGFWHGATWLYIFYGFIQGAGMIVHRIWSRELHRKMPHVCGVILTFLFACFSFVIVRAANFAQICRLMRSLTGGTTFACNFDFSANVLTALLISFGVCFFMPRANSYMTKFRPDILHLFAALFLFIACVFCLNRISPFIYFNF